MIYLGWIPRIFRTFFCAKIFYFWPVHMKAHIEKCKKRLKFFRLCLNIHDFFDFFEVFRIKLLNPIEPSHVLSTIRFSIKFHVGLSMYGRWAWLGKNGFIRRTVRKWDFTRVEIAWVNSKSNKPTLKSIPKSPDTYKKQLCILTWKSAHAY